MAVNEKRGDIAILKTMGASHWSLRAIFIVQGAFNGLVGSVIGALAGCYIAMNLTALVQSLEGLIGHKILSGDIYFINFLPSELDLQQAVVITLLAFIMSVIATLYPAWSASNIQPAQELGYSH
jgi:lipoprotein-releasing system permease protein